MATHAVTNQITTKKNVLGQVRSVQRRPSAVDRFRQRLSDRLRFGGDIPPAANQQQRQHQHVSLRMSHSIPLVSIAEDEDTIESVNSFIKRT